MFQIGGSPVVHLFGTALIALAIIASALSNPLALIARAPEPAAFQAPASPRVTYNFNPGWKFIREDVPNAVKSDFDDTAWTSVSTPHTWNDVDSYRSFISHSGGDRNAFSGIGWYRKHFKLPAGAKNGRVFLEFEGLKQAGRFFVNGQPAGKFENGITACGLDITSLCLRGRAVTYWKH
jgi:beta-galactosidase